MENEAAKRIEKDDDDDAGSGSCSDSCSDRISQLPESVLHHILCFLSQKKAVQTSVLSKSWRHLGPTRPVIELRGACGHEYTHPKGIDIVCENCFKGNKESFLSVVDNTFQRYHDLNLFPKEIRLNMLEVDSQSISVLEKWIPIFISPDNPALTTFSLSFGTPYNMPSLVLKAASLRELSLKWCRLNHDINSIEDNFLLKHLQKLSLSEVTIADEVMEMLLAGCPLVKHVVLSNCPNLKTVKIANKKNPYLSCFEFSSFYRRGDETSIEIDAPTLQSISIDSCSDWYPNHFPRLKSLYLSKVNLSTGSFENFSSNFPCLEELSLLDCLGFEEINLSSCSIKRLIIHETKSSLKKIAIEVPNILYFELSSSIFPTLSLTTTSREWKSDLNLLGCLFAYRDDVLPGILKLFGLVKALSQSQISMRLCEVLLYMTFPSEWDFNDHPLVVEHLSLDIFKPCPDSLTPFLNVLFRIFRPRYTNAMCSYLKDDEQVIEFLWKTLIHDRQKMEYGWEQHLKEVSVEAFDEKEKVWQHAQWTCLPEWSENHQRIRFPLKWRD